ncbi:MAG: formylglycine-generating enzyme family protein [Planctomycetota bacterium]
MPLIVAGFSQPATGETATGDDTGSCCPPTRAMAMLAAATTEPASANAQPTADAPNDQLAAPAEAPPGMVWVPGGAFTMGSDAPGAWPNEGPPHRVRVDGFWMDRTEVTNAQFAEFVDATGYVTVAERPIDWEVMKQQVPPGTPKPPDEMLAAGSLVFTPPAHPVPLNNLGAWWSWTTGANWREPAGPGSSIEGKDDHPVVHVAWDDAVAYTEWAGKQLPTEAQWEYAARGGLDNARFGWGDTFRPDGQTMANTWDGAFPHRNTLDDGHLLAAPVASFPPNGYGLHDMGGNVWEWTADWYRDDRHAQLRRDGLVVNPPGPDAPRDAANPNAPSRVIKGGSFLCHVDYCESYRPSARRGLPTDTGLQHQGFRCIIVPEPAEPPAPTP